MSLRSSKSTKRTLWLIKTKQMKTTSNWQSKNLTSCKWIWHNQLEWEQFEQVTSANLSNQSGIHPLNFTESLQAIKVGSDQLLYRHAIHSLRQAVLIGRSSSGIWHRASWKLLWQAISTQWGVLSSRRPTRICSPVVRISQSNVGIWKWIKLSEATMDICQVSIVSKFIKGLVFLLQEAGTVLPEFGTSESEGKFIRLLAMHIQLVLYWLKNLNLMSLQEVTIPLSRCGTSAKVNA